MTHPKQDHQPSQRVQSKWDNAHGSKEYQTRKRFVHAHPVVKNFVEHTYLEGKSALGLISRYHHLPFRTALELGCGRGDLAVSMVTGQVVESLKAYDISETAIRIARNKAVERGITSISFDQADLNTLKLTPKTYDLIYCSQALHHVENLEHVLKHANSALKHDGIFFASDYVGPSRMQWTETQLMIMNELLNALPRSHRALSGGGLGQGYKDRLKRTPIETYLQVDPSEGARSAEIVPLARKYLDVIDVIPWGGTIVYELLRGIVHNFDEQSSQDTSILDLICTFEKILINLEIIPSDFSVIVGRKKNTCTTRPLLDH
jgi:2-polyprenyl-3-methyl-5-hydroxy-6-metoxy-1,4-benzoquinol methylase